MGPKKILIVEDEKPMAHAMDLKLSKLGFATTVANNGEEATQHLADTKFDLVLLDLILPKLDGFGVLDFMKEKGNKVPVIVLSNLGQEEDRKKVEAFGVLDYFVKSNTPIADIASYVQKYFTKE